MENEVEQGVESVESLEKKDQQDLVKMQENVQKELKTSHPIFPGGEFENAEKSQLWMSTPFLLGFLFVVFFVLKSFIYTKDDKRHGK